MTNSTATILHGNGHNEHSLVDWVASTHDMWDSAGLAEADRLIPALRKIKGAKVFVTDATYDRAKDTPILVSRQHKIIDWHARRVSKGLGDPGSDLRRVAPPRTLTTVSYHHELADALGAEGLCHIVIHPDAGPQQLSGNDRGAQIVVQYMSAWSAARNTWHEAKKHGLIPFITSDGQMPKAWAGRSWSPTHYAKLLGANIYYNNIDVMLWDKRLKMVGKPKVHKLYDHNGFMITLGKA